MTTTLEDARTALAATSGLAEIIHPYGDQLAFRSARNDAGQDEVWFDLGRQSYRLEREAAFSAVTRLPGGSETMAERWPLDLVIPALTFFFQHREGEFKALVDSEGTLRQFVKPSALLFDPVRVLDAMADAMGQHGGKENVVVKDFTHSLDETHFSVIVPQGMAESFVEARPGDVTVGGLYFTGSLLGKGKTELAVFTDRVLCSNGMVSPASSTRFRAGNTEEGAEGPMDKMLEWLVTSCESLTHHSLPEEFQRLRHLTEHVVDDAHLATTMADIFSRFSIPATAHSPIHEALVEEADGTMYGIVQAITRAAQHAPGLTDSQRYALMRRGGDVTLHAQVLCDTCQRPMPDGAA